MKVVVYLLTILSFSTALPTQSWDQIKGINVYVEPKANYTVDTPANGRIAGGDEVSPHSRPYMVGLLINGRSFCTGTLISPSYVLSAAHCTNVASYMVVIFGAHDVNTQESTQLRVVSSSIINHPKFNRTSLNNDISLIKTPSPIVTNNYIQMIRLPPADAGTYEFYTAALSGWGTTSDTSSGITTGLREVYLMVLMNRICGETFAPTYNESTNICTSGAGPVGACSGDSGGPLVVGRDQIGIVSFISTKGCMDSFPTGYTRVSYYREWINGITGL